MTKQTATEQTVIRDLAQSGNRQSALLVSRAHQIRTEREMNQIKYNLPAADYHAIKAVSNSGLKWFRRSPAHYKAMRQGIIKPEPTEAQTTGTLVHSLILEGKADFVTSPATYTNDKGESKP